MKTEVKTMSNEMLLKQLKTWFKEFYTINRENRVKEHFLIQKLSDNPLDNREGFKCQFYTRTYQYNVIATDSYLGASFLVRKPLAGEDWNRGNDLADGNFSQETWDRIKSEIIRNEIVKISKIILDEKHGKF